MPIQQMFLGAGGASAPESFEYFYNGSTSTTITVPGAVSFFKVAGVAAGSPGPNSTGSNTGGHAGGGGGAGNLAGYTVPNATVAGQTIYIGTSPNGPSYIKTGSHSGTAIWEAGASSGQPGGSMVAGPGNEGGSGGSVAPRYNTGNPGFGAPNAGSGGGSGGGHTDGDGGSGSGQPGGSGGTTSVSGVITPLGVGPAPAWSISGTSGGGGGGTESPGSAAPNSGAGGGTGGQPWGNANSGGGGGGGGVVIYGNSYGGGGGGAGSNHPSPTGQPGGSGKGGFLIIQLTY
jgi:hypothetical protein